MHQPQQFTPFTPAVRTPSHPHHQPTQYSSGLTVRGDDQQQLPFNGQKSSRICRHYQRGRCTWGEHCRFLHEGAVMPQKDERGYGYGGGDGFMGGGGGGMGGHGGHGHGGMHHGGGGYGGGHGGMQDPQSRNVLLGLNQARLQAMRHAKLITALKGNYDVQPTHEPGQHQVTSAGLDPDIVTFLSQEQLSSALNKLDEDERFKEAGLLMYVVGEPSVFYSAIRAFTNTGTCGHNRMDVALAAARDHGLVECMFFRSAAGCQAPKCSYEHRSLTAAGSGGSTSGGSFGANPTAGNMSNSSVGFTGQQRFTAAASHDERKPNPSGSDLGQWDQLEKVVDTLKAVDEDASSNNWGGSSTGGQFLAVGAGNSTTSPGTGPAQPGSGGNNNTNNAASGESAGSIW